MKCITCNAHGPTWNFPEPGTCLECKFDKIIDDFCLEKPYNLEVENG